MRILTTASIAAILAVLAGPAAHAQEAANIVSTNHIIGFSELLNTTAGQDVLTKNLSTSIATNNGSTLEERNQAIYDNTISALVGSFSNAQLVTDALGQKLSDAFNSTNALHPDYTATTFSPVYADLVTQVNMLAQSNSSFAKNYLANGSVDGNPAHPASGISLPPGGQFNVYDKAYMPDPANANTVGNSRPFQVAPASIETFVGKDYFGHVEDSSLILPTLKSNASFPSGHTMFGQISSTLLAMMVPERFQEMLTRGSEYGNSRVVLGAHYALDTIGARIQALQTLTAMLNNDPDYTDRAYRTALGQAKISASDFKPLFASATSDLRAMLETQCGGTIADCIATSTPDRFSDKAKNEANYTYRLTYGLPPVGDTTLAPVVPEGAEVLLSTRFTYLDDEQRREVLATTELASGAPLDDGSGWARLDLYKAANGYGAFRSDVDVTMNKADGGFAAADVWSNDISGPGGLTKRGDGKLTLSGKNSYLGATQVEGGELAVTGTVAGDVAVAALAELTGNGTIGGNVTVKGTIAPGTALDATGHLTIGGDLSFAPFARLAIDVAGSKPGLFDQLTVGGDLALDGAVLDFTLVKGVQIAAGRFLELIDLIGARTGLFDGLSEGGLVASRNGTAYRITYVGGDGNDVGIYTAPVPLPATLGLMAVALGGLGAAARRRRG